MTSHAVVTRFPRVIDESAPGGRIKERRKSLGMPATRLAKEAEVSREHLSAVENGHKRPTQEWVRRVELAMKRYALETGQEYDGEEPTTEEPAMVPEPIRLTFHDIYGIGEIIAEGPGDKPDELVSAVVKLLDEIRRKGQER
jgi:transcriptional regulator with XRE-family HTH domain